MVETGHKVYVFPCLRFGRHNIVFNSRVICSVIIAVYGKNNNNRGTEQLSNFWFKLTQTIESNQISFSANPLLSLLFTLPPSSPFSP